MCFDKHPFWNKLGTISGVEGDAPRETSSSLRQFPPTHGSRAGLGSVRAVQLVSSVFGQHRILASECVLLAFPGPRSRRASPAETGNDMPRCDHSSRSRSALGRFLIAALLTAPTPNRGTPSFNSAGRPLSVACPSLAPFARSAKPPFPKPLQSQCPCGPDGILWRASQPSPASGPQPSNCGPTLSAASNF